MTDTAADIGADIGALSAPMVARRFWVCFSETIGPPEQVFPHLPAHLRHVIGWEQQGVLFAGGPFLTEDGTPGARAMFVFRVDTQEQATALAADEPLHKLGLTTFTVHSWQLNQGRISVHVDFSCQTGGLDGQPAPDPRERSVR